MSFIANHFIKFENLHSFFKIVGIAYLIPLLMSLSALAFNFPHHDLFFSASRAIGTFGNANSFAYITLLMLPIILFLVLKSGGCYARVAWIVVLTVLLFNLLLTMSFSAFLILLFLIFVNSVLFYKYRKRLPRHFLKKYLMWIVGIGFVMGASLFLITLFNSSFHNTLLLRLNIGHSGLGSSADRISLMENALEILLKTPQNFLLGIGLQQASFYELSPSGVAETVHNTYILMLLETGAFGLLAFLMIWFQLYKNINSLKYLDLSVYILLLNLFLIFLLIMFFNPHTYLRYFFIPVMPIFVSGWIRESTQDCCKSNSISGGVDGSH
ncbi:O-antigen ligase [Hydrogenovibrio sp. JE_KL2]|uniref:O-antigen ligase family protein n=1 Tax=Hydrogenovibrio sp. JE_KL2 TaxID=2651188 RepID=UPI0015626D54|nr:O-antigen ligase family protein [Hydrogenovibrio sp. JE_KL2]